jgi:hypothetical protein
VDYPRQEPNVTPVSNGNPQVPPAGGALLGALQALATLSPEEREQLMKLLGK